MRGRLEGEIEVDGIWDSVESALTDRTLRSKAATSLSQRLNWVYPPRTRQDATCYQKDTANIHFSNRLPTPLVHQSTLQHACTLSKRIQMMPLSPKSAHILRPLLLHHFRSIDLFRPKQPSEGQRSKHHAKHIYPNHNKHNRQNCPENLDGFRVESLPNSLGSCDHGCVREDE